MSQFRGWMSILRVVLFCGLLQGFSYGEEPVSESKAGAIHALFNGKDLAGWSADVPMADKKEGVAPSFTVRGGNLVSLGEPRGHLITDQEYENFKLKVEYRFPKEPGNCGILVHVSKLRYLYKMFPASIEVQMHHENAGDFWCIGEDLKVPDMERRRPKGKGQNWGGEKGDARRIFNLTDGSEKEVGEWNEMVVECRGDEIKVWVNGDLVNHGVECTTSKGRIALQAEGAEVEFRALVLESLSMGKVKDEG